MGRKPACRLSMALVALLLAGAAARAAPVVTFDLANVPTTAIPGSEVHTLSLRYAIAGSDLRDARIAIDLPANVIPVGATHAASFVGDCEYDSPHDPYEGDRTQDWRCAWNAAALDIPEGGLSGQIVLSVIYRRWGFGKGDVVTFAPTFDASWDDGGVTTAIAQRSASATTTIDGAVDARFDYISWVLYDDYAYTTLSTPSGPVTGLRMPLSVQVSNHGTIAIAEGSRIELDLPAGMLFAGARSAYNIVPAPGTVPGVTGTIALITPQTLGLAWAVPAFEGGGSYTQGYYETDAVLVVIDVVVPCGALPLPPTAAIGARLRGIAPGISSGATVLATTSSPAPTDQFARVLCAQATRWETGTWSSGVSQNSGFTAKLFGPTGVVPVYDAFASAFIQAPLRLTGAFLQVTMGTPHSAADDGFVLYACRLPGVSTPITRTEFEALPSSACLPLVLDNNYTAVPPATTHLVVYGQHDVPWVENSALGPTVWMPLVMTGQGYVAGCMEGAVEQRFTISTYAEASDGVTSTSDTDAREVVAPITHRLAWNGAGNSPSATRGRPKTLVYYASGAYGALRNPVVTMPVPPGVVIEAVRFSGSLATGCVAPPLHWSVNGGLLTITNGSSGAPWYLDESCSVNQCQQGGPLSFALDVFFPTDQPFLDGQVLEFAATLTGDNVAPNGPASETWTVPVTMQVPTEMRLVLEPACLDDDGTLLTGVRARAVNSGGTPLTHVVIDLPVPKKDDGSGTQVDTVLASVTSVYGPVTCSTDGVTFAAPTCNDPATTDVRVTVPTLAPYTSEVVSLYFAPDAGAPPGAVVRHRASLTSNELLPVHAPPGPPARWGQCPGEVAIDGWFDEATPGVRDAFEAGLENWQVTFTDAADPNVIFGVTLPPDGRLGFAVGAGTYDVTATAPFADADAVWSFSPALPSSITVTSSSVAHLEFGATCACDDGADCTIDSCDRGACAHTFDYDNVDCESWCGDGVLQGDETCETGVTYDLLRGCLGCQCSPYGFQWDNDTQTCRPLCGDSLLFGDETCDDGNLVSGDGCDANCQIESGWQCDRPADGCPPASVCGETPAAWCSWADPAQPMSAPTDWCAALAEGALFPFCGRTLDCQTVDRDCLNPSGGDLDCLFDAISCDLCVALGPSTCTPSGTESCRSLAGETCDAQRAIAYAIVYDAADRPVGTVRCAQELDGTVACDESAPGKLKVYEGLFCPGVDAGGVP